jgi:hypothetical protein
MEGVKRHKAIMAYFFNNNWKGLFLYTKTNSANSTVQTIKTLEHEV